MSEELKNVLDLCKEIDKKVEDFKGKALSREEYEGQTEALVTKLIDAREKQAAAEREKLAIFPTGNVNGDPRAEGLKAAFQEKTPEAFAAKLSWAFAQPTESKALEQLKGAHDELAIVAAVMGARHKGNFRLDSLKTYRKWVDIRDRACKYMDTADTSNWVPTGEAAVLLEVPQVLGNVESLFEHIYCPTKSYDYPVYLNGPDVIGSLESETTAYSNPAADFTSVTQALTDGKITFTAVTCKGRMVTSGELDEDSIIAIVPAIKTELARIDARSVEHAILNGDTTATHMDTDIEALGATDFRTAWKGLRYHGLNGGSGGLRVSGSGTFAISGMRSIRGKMGAYGVNPRDLAWIVSIKTYVNKLIGNDDVRTMDKYGPMATVFTGELGQLDGIPVVVSACQRDGLNASGVQDGVTQTMSTVLLVNRNYWKVGDRRLFTIEAERLAGVNQYVFYGRRRVAFMPHQTPDATYSSVACYYNYTY